MVEIHQGVECTVHNRNRCSKCPASAWKHAWQLSRNEPRKETNCLGTMSAAAASLQLIRSLDPKLRGILRFPRPAQFLADYDAPFQLHVGNVVSQPDIDTDITWMQEENFRWKTRARNAYLLGRSVFTVLLGCLYHRPSLRTAAIVCTSTNSERGAPIE